MSGQPPTAPSTPVKKPQRANRSSDEEAYAGPAEPITTSQLPLSPATTVATLSPTRKRTRRVDGAAEDEPPILEDGIVTAHLRVGTPELCRLPAEFRALTDRPELLDWLDQKVRAKTREILDRHGIESESLHFGYRSGRFDQRGIKEWPLAVIFWTRRSGGDYKARWRHACAELRELVKAAPGGVRIAIEIVDLETLVSTRSFAIGPEDEIVQVWPTLKPLVVNVLKATSCLELKVLRRGKDEQALKNPVTLFVTVPDASTDDWVAVRDRLVEILDDMELFEMAVEISRGTLWPYTDFGVKELPDEIWEVAAKGGQSLGVSGLSCGSSTLGGFVEVQDAGGEWRAFGLTCYHSLFPPKVIGGESFDKKQLHRWHDQGFIPDEMARHRLEATQPSRTDFESSLRSWVEIQSKHQRDRDALLTKLARDEMLAPGDGGKLQLHESLIRVFQEQTDRAQQFISAGLDLLGPVWAGSGLRVSENKETLDWGLVEIGGQRLGDNTLPTGRARPFTTFVPRTGRIIRTAKVARGEEVFKQGRSSGWTMGTYNGIDAVTFKDEVYGNEDGTARICDAENHTVVTHRNQAQAFSAPGDSGAFVLDAAGDLVGLVTGGDPTGSTARFTSISSIFSDILRMTGGQAVRVLEQKP